MAYKPADNIMNRLLGRAREIGGGIGDYASWNDARAAMSGRYGKYVRWDQLDKFREQQSWDCERCYDGHAIMFLEKNPEETPEDFDDRPKVVINLLRVWIDILGGLYMNGATRLLKPSGRLAIVLEKIWRDIDPLMVVADRMVALHGTIAMRVFWEENTGISYVPYPSYQFRILENVNNPWQPLGIALRWREHNPDRSGADTEVCDLWTATHNLRLRDWHREWEHKNPYGRLPFVFLHDQLDTRHFWVEGRGAALMACNIAYNNKMTDLAHTVKMQGFGVPVAENIKPGTEFRISPGVAVELQTDRDRPGKLSFVNPNAPIHDVWEDAERLRKEAQRAARIPEAAVSVEPSVSQSGVALRAKSFALLEMRTERQSLFRTYERELCKLTADVLHVHDLSLPAWRDSYEFSIDYPEPTEEQNPRERRDMDEFRLIHGMATPWELMMRDDPDRWNNKEEAKAAWLLNRREMGDAEKDLMAETSDDELLSFEENDENSEVDETEVGSKKKRTEEEDFVGMPGFDDKVA